MRQSLADRPAAGSPGPLAAARERWDAFIGRLEAGPLGPVVAAVQGRRRLLSDKQAIIAAHLGLLLLGLMFHQYRSDNGLHRMLNPGLETDPRDLRRFLIYGLGLAVLLAGILNGAAAWLARRADRPRGQVLAELSRALWPLAFLLFGLPTLAYEVADTDFFIHILAPALALSAGLAVHRGIAIRRGPLPPDLAWPAPHRAREILLASAGLLAALILLYTMWWTHFTIMRFRGMLTGLHDLGIYDNLMWNTMRGRPLECGMFRFEMIGYDVHKFGNNFFAEHIIPTFWIVTPAYWLHPSPRTLLAAQSFMLAMAAVPFFLVARRKTGSPAIAALFALCLLAHPALHSANIVDFHIDTFIPFFMFAAYAAYLHKKMVLYWIMLALALGCKEEASIGVAFMGVFIALAERDWKMGLATWAAGTAYFVFAIGFAMPYFRGGEPMRQIDRFGHLFPAGFIAEGASPGKTDLLRALVLHPGHAFQQLATQERFGAFFMLMAPFAMLALFCGWAWVWALPIAGIHLMAGYGPQPSLDSYYAITPVIPIALGSVYGLCFLMRRMGWDGKSWPSPRLHGAVAIALVLNTGIMWYQVLDLPGGGLRIERYVTTHRIMQAHKYLHAIPEDAVVSATSRLAGQLSSRRFVYNFPEMGEGSYVPPDERDGSEADRDRSLDVPAEFVIIDVRSRSWPLYGEDEWVAYYHRLVRGIVQDPEWGLVLPYDDFDGILLLRRGHPTTLNEGVLERLDFEEYDRTATWREMQRRERERRGR